jgi:hypothetical protein
MHYSTLNPTPVVTEPVMTTPPRKRQKTNPLPRFSPGELGKCADAFAHDVARLGWNGFFDNHYHLSYSSINPNISTIPHLAAPFLHRLATRGVPAPSAQPPWTLQQQDAAVPRGPHPSARHQHSTFLLEDMFAYVQQGYLLVLPYSAIRGHPLLKIAPAGVVPQRERRPRPIMDYSYNGVNQAALDVAPRQAMQFGASLQRLLQRIAYANPVFGPPLLAKLDLADGYYRVPLAAGAALELAVVLPPDATPEPLIGLPLSLPMGWCNSPPYFCAFTETCADLANTSPTPPTPHQFDFVINAQDDKQSHAFVSEAIWPHNPDPPPNPLDYVDVYLDDFMLAVQHPLTRTTMDRVLRHLNTVFYDPSGSLRKSVVSETKVAKGDATFQTRQRILGWDIDTEQMVIQLPTHRKDRLQELLAMFQSKRYASKRKWQKLLGELRSMAMAIHSAKYLFCVLQQGLKCEHTRILRALVEYPQGNLEEIQEKTLRST